MSAAPSCCPQVATDCAAPAVSHPSHDGPKLQLVEAPRELVELAMVPDSKAHLPTSKPHPLVAQHPVLHHRQSQRSSTGSSAPPWHRRGCARPRHPTPPCTSQKRRYVRACTEVHPRAVRDRRAWSQAPDVEQNHQCFPATGTRTAFEAARTRWSSSGATVRRAYAWRPQLWHSAASRGRKAYRSKSASPPAGCHAARGQPCAKWLHRCAALPVTCR
mmetsp:Transcript_34150/g.91119  ORF Transcript_34150/g.91119 Transcript_34150/m.91119 type:complete len:217 (+) Transcript_34150:580-1230(+)